MIWGPRAVLEKNNPVLEDFNRLYTWDDNNNMVFNHDKFQVVNFSRTDSGETDTYHTPNGAEIKPQVRDLGMYVSVQTLNSAKHVLPRPKRVLPNIVSSTHSA